MPEVGKALQFLAMWKQTEEAFERTSQPFDEAKPARNKPPHWAVRFLCAP
jgi:hypothetical protein